MGYVIRGIDPTPFVPLYGLDDAALAARGVRRCAVDATPGFPDRVELRDLEPGETALLLNHLHQPARTPYRGRHAIFVREGAREAAVVRDRIPDVLHRRILSLRAFDAEGMMLDADLAEGDAIDATVRRLLADARVASVHAHNAKRGCFAARIERD
ncbi:DUF1203 domain-containing protein [Tolypothrix campylonemoides VB511288]|nr:DUF1203 domain-containing protein [Tolypothrix campylonemoides VB511288]